MSNSSPSHLAIVDYGLGNLFSVKNACERVGMRATITSSRQEISSADGVILPGVGAFGDAIESLNKLDLVDPLRDFSLTNKPLIGICLGMQLLMDDSYEFGLHQGLGIIQGSVVRLGECAKSLDAPEDGNVRTLKVPYIGWNRVFKPDAGDYSPDHTKPDPWAGTPLDGLGSGEFMYFVHSFYAKPKDPSLVLSTSQFGNAEFCSTLRYLNTFGCQFHPERSGPQGLQFYSNIASMLSLAS